MSNLDIRISQNGYARGWYWEVVKVEDQEVVGRGLAATYGAAKAQAQDHIEFAQSAQRRAG